MIYLELIGEGTDVWRPVEAELLDDDVYRITSSLDDPDEVWRFLPGELVCCERRELSEGAVLVATEKAQRRDQKQPFLVVYDYGQGGLWALVHARTTDEIHRRYSELKVFARTPDWMQAEMLQGVLAESYDIDVPPSGLLASLVEGRSGA